MRATWVVPKTWTDGASTMVRRVPKNGITVVTVESYDNIIAHGHLAENNNEGCDLDAIFSRTLPKETQKIDYAIGGKSLTSSSLHNNSSGRLSASTSCFLRFLPMCDISFLWCFLLLFLSLLAALPPGVQCSYRAGDESGISSGGAGGAAGRLGGGAGGACGAPCENGGTCFNGTCACVSGFSGVLCEHCYHRVRISGSSQGQLTTGYFNGTLSGPGGPGAGATTGAGGSNSAALLGLPIEGAAGRLVEVDEIHRRRFLSCSWIIESPLGDDPSSSGSFVHFNILAAPNCSKPSLWAYTGDSVYGRRHVALSCGELGHFSVPGRRVTIDFHFRPDRVTRGFDPWVLQYRITPCRYPCQNGGICDFSSQTCKCPAGFRGQNCDELICDPKKCVHGSCDQSSGACNCDPGFRGQNCKLSSAEAYWNVTQPHHESASSPSSKGSTLPPVSRAGHVAVVLSNYMYVIGGYTINAAYNRSGSGTTEESASNSAESESNAEDSPMVSMVMRYSFAKNKWTRVNRPPTDDAPSLAPRFGHSVVSYGEELFTFGGQLLQGVPGGKITAELWSFKPRQGKWTLVQGDHGDYVDQPFGVVGHTAHVYKGQMLVFGGFSKFRGYINYIQQYSFTNRSWSVFPTRGAFPYETYGHSSVMSSDNKVYLYGGYYPTSINNGAVSDRLYVLDLAKAEWTFMSNGPAPAYGHSAVILGGLMLIFGGYSRNNETVVPAGGPLRGSSCYSRSIWTYDMMCNENYDLDGPPLTTSGAAGGGGIGFLGSIPEGRSTAEYPFYRHGHSAVVYNDQMYIFGGFNGRTLGDMVRFVPGECSGRKDRDACQMPAEGSKCVLYQGECIPVRAMAPESANKFGKHTSKRQDTPTGGRPLGILYGTCPDLSKKRPVLDEQQADLACAAITDCQTCSYTSERLGCSWCKQKRLCSKWQCPPRASQFTMGGEAGRCGHTDQHTCHRKFTCIACEALSNCRFVVQNLTTGAPGQHGGVMLAKSKSAARTSRPILPTNGMCTLRAPAESGRDRICRLAPCEDHDSCGKCTAAGVRCAWCAALGRCLEQNAVAPLVDLYGFCPMKITRPRDCRLYASPCELYKTCATCLTAGSGCGWCDDGSNRGIGECFSGGLIGPSAVPHSLAPSSMANDTESSSSTPDGEEGPSCRSPQTWYFTQCPSCQCNGHAYCVSPNSTTSVHSDGDGSAGETPEGASRSGSATGALTSLTSAHYRVGGVVSHAGGGGLGLAACEQPCEDNTVGQHCERCADYYFGDPRNGGNCSRCDCNGQADTCNPVDGACYCRTKGVTGKNCDICLPDKSYVGDPKTSTCFYQLAVDYMFTFPITVPDEVNITQLNFLSTPSSAADVVFKLECTNQGPSGLAPRINLTLQSNAWPGERWFFRANPCSKITRRFDKDEYKIGGDHNTTFFIYIYNIRAPMQFKISFAQSADIWLRFFITFASCFVSLLCAGALMWKLKMRFDVYRRRQRMFVEMAAMASRPFGCAHLDVKPGNPYASLGGSGDASSGPGPTGATGAGPGVGSKTGGNTAGGTGAGAGTGTGGAASSAYLNPICIEPCSNYKAAIVTVAVRLPTGGHRHTPAGQTGLAVASALVSLTPSQAVHLQASPSSPEPARKRRGWKPMCIS